MTITKTELKSFRIDFGEAVKRLEEKYDSTIKIGSISFGQHDFTSRLTVRKNSVVVDGETTSIDQVEFEKSCELYGLKKEDFGKTFKSNGKKFTITGLNPRATKNVVKLQADNGKGYKSSAESVKRNLAFAELQQ